MASDNSGHTSRAPEWEIEVLRAHITDRRWARMNEILDQRTRRIAVAVEDIYQPHNASAVLRSCDAFGVQDIHIIEERNRYQTNPGVELGTAQWLTLHRYRQAGATRRAYEAARSMGYRVIATSPHESDATPDLLDLSSSPVLLVFGTEKDGLSSTACDEADGFVRIPMRGFVESLNISVSAAILLQRLTQRLRDEDLDWPLSDAERTGLLARWARASVRHAEAILDRADADRRER